MESNIYIDYGCGKVLLDEKWQTLYLKDLREELNKTYSESFYFAKQSNGRKVPETLSSIYDQFLGGERTIFVIFENELLAAELKEQKKQEEQALSKKAKEDQKEKDQREAFEQMVKHKDKIMVKDIKIVEQPGTDCLMDQKIRELAKETLVQNSGPILKFSEQRQILENLIQNKHLYKGIILLPDGEVKRSYCSAYKSLTETDKRTFMQDCMDFSSRSKESSVKVVESFRKFEYISQGIGQEDISARIPLVFSTSNQVSFENNQQKQGSSHKIVVYKIELIPQIEITFDQNQKIDGNLLTFFTEKPVTFENVKKFYENYGVYVPRKVYFGGKFIVYAESESNSKETIQEIAVQLQSQVGGITEGVIVNNDFQKGNKKKSKTGQIDKAYIMHTKWTGGSKNSYDFSEWAKSLNDPNLWEAIEFEGLTETISYLPKELQVEIRKAEEDAKVPKEGVLYRICSSSGEYLFLADEDVKNSCQIVEARSGGGFGFGGQSKFSWKFKKGSGENEWYIVNQTTHYKHCTAPEGKPQQGQFMLVSTSTRGYSKSGYYVLGWNDTASSSWEGQYKFKIVNVEGNKVKIISCATKHHLYLSNEHEENDRLILARFDDVDDGTEVFTLNRI